MGVEESDASYVLPDECNFMLAEKMESLGLSARAFYSIIGLARSVADLDGLAEIDEASLAEAIGYRSYGDGDAYWPF
jgi:magnesium chelatase family protein